MHLDDRYRKGLILTKNSYIIHGSIGNVFIVRDGILPISLRINVLISSEISISVNYNHSDASSFLFGLIPGRDIFVTGFPRKHGEKGIFEIDALTIEF